MSLAARIQRLEQRINRPQDRRFFLVAGRTAEEQQSRIQAARAAGHVVQGDIVVALPWSVHGDLPASRWIGDRDRLTGPEDEALGAECERLLAEAMAGTSKLPERTDKPGCGAVERMSDHDLTIQILGRPLE